MFHLFVFSDFYPFMTLTKNPPQMLVCQQELSQVAHSESCHPGWPEIPRHSRLDSTETSLYLLEGRTKGIHHHGTTSIIAFLKLHFMFAGILTTGDFYLDLSNFNLILL